jgi:hypothetical protein
MALKHSGTFERKCWINDKNTGTGNDQIADFLLRFMSSSGAGSRKKFRILADPAPDR